MAHRHILTRVRYVSAEDEGASFEEKMPRLVVELEQSIKRNLKRLMYGR